MSNKSLKKSLGLLDVFAISSGAMIASGFFVLPGIAASQAGPAVIIAYVFAGLSVIPAVFSLSELSTAMPRSGGTYFFISRSLGPMFGTIDGLGDWLALLLKASIAIVGLGLYLDGLVNLPYVTPKTISVFFALFFTGLNLLGTKEAGSFQVGMVFFLFAIMSIFIVKGTPVVKGANYTPFAPFGLDAIMPTAGLIFTSFIGLTGVASVSEEIKNPARNIPLGMFLSLIAVIIMYALGVFVVVGVLPAEQLRGSLTPISDAARIFAGRTGAIGITIAAALAFATTGNAGLMAASRYLLAMGRDRVIPHAFTRLSRRRIPKNAVLFSSVFMIFIIIFFGVEAIAKLAGTFQILVFAIINMAVIVMRESGLKSYDPEFRSPLYPYMQIAGILVAVLIIPQMGFVAMFFTLALIAAGVVWYYLHVRRKGIGVSAVSKAASRVAERLLDHDAHALGLDKELRQILKEKGLRHDDPFVKILKEADFIEIKPHTKIDKLLRKASDMLGNRSGVSCDIIYGAILERSLLGETPADAGVALPHLLLDDVDDFYLVMGRSITGIDFPNSKQSIHAVFVLLGSRKDPNRHLRFLAEIASRAEDPHFIDEWIQADGRDELIEVILTDEEQDGS
ncbi:MAG TPA: amino acid permease [candidate division Zixibacteria bacterium]|nr:amino acid permease [candidate division Zixibacteria bacterium]